MQLKKRKHPLGVLVDFVCPKSLTLHKESFFGNKDTSMIGDETEFLIFFYLVLKRKHAFFQVNLTPYTETVKVPQLSFLHS